MPQTVLNKLFFYLTIFALIFGVILYDTLKLIFVDEICAVLLVGLYCYYIYKTPKWEINKVFVITLGIFLFYLVYSLAIKSNVKRAILIDFTIQIKPYLGFFCAYAIAPLFNKKQKLIIKCLCIAIAFYLMFLGILSLFIKDFLYTTMSHPSRFATAVSIISILYLYVSDYTMKDKIIFVTIMLFGLLSGRSKFYGFMILATFLIFFLKYFNFKINLKNSIILLVIFGIVFLATKNKIFTYFDPNSFGKGKGLSDLYARMALYYFSGFIFMDYIPFGSGFASYATYASSIYYSPLYPKYNIDMVWGLSKDYPAFICDAYYPVLAQFGIIGATLFFAFWLLILSKAYRWFQQTSNIKLFTLVIVMVIFFLIECTSDSTITHNRGFFMMMILGMVLSDFQREYKNRQKEITTPSAEEIKP